MILLPFTVVLVVFCAHVSFATSSNIETGLTQVPRDSTDETCSQNFVCITTAPGSATEILFNDSAELIEFRHALYENGAGEMSKLFGGDVIAGNLSRFAINGTNDYCYTTNIHVQITENTRCKIMTCQTRRTVGTGSTARDEIQDFGSKIVTSVPQPPSIITANQTSSGINFTWNSATDVCSSFEEYDVSTSNCGNCSTSVNETTCLNPIEGQNCSITIKTRTQCAISEPVTCYILVTGTSPSTTQATTSPNATQATTSPNATQATTATESNLGEIIGGSVGGGVAAVVILILGIIALTLCCCCLKRRFSGKVHHKQTNGARNINTIPQDDKPEIETDVGVSYATAETINLTEVATNGTTRSPAEASLIEVATNGGASGTTRSPAEASLIGTSQTVQRFANSCMESSTSGASNTTGEVISTPLQVTQSGTEQTLKAVGVKPGSGHPIPHSVPASEDTVSYNERLTNLEDKVQQQGDKHEEDMKSMKLEVQRLKDEIQTLRTKCQELEETHKVDTAEIEQLKAQRTKCQELEETHKVDTAEIEQLKAQIRDLEQQLAAAKTREEKLERKKSPR